MTKIYEADAETRELATRCASILTCVAFKRGQSSMELELFGVSQKGAEIGDWRVTIECINYPGHDC